MHGNRSQQDLKKEVLFQLAHTAHHQLVLLEGILPMVVLTGRKVRSDLRQPAASVFSRVWMSNSQQAVWHPFKGIIEPSGHVDIYISKANLWISGRHTGFKGSRAVDCQSFSFFDGITPPYHTVQLDNPQTLGMEHACHQINHLHIAAVHTP